MASNSTKGSQCVIYFAHKPAKPIHTALKSMGFAWRNGDCTQYAVFAWKTDFENELNSFAQKCPAFNPTEIKQEKKTPYIIHFQEMPNNEKLLDILKDRNFQWWNKTSVLGLLNPIIEFQQSHLEEQLRGLTNINFKIKEIASLEDLLGIETETLEDQSIETHALGLEVSLTVNDCKEIEVSSVTPKSNPYPHFFGNEIEQELFNAVQWLPGGMDMHFSFATKAKKEEGKEEAKETRISRIYLNVTRWNTPRQEEIGSIFQKMERLHVNTSTPNLVLPWILSFPNLSILEVERLPGNEKEMKNIKFDMSQIEKIPTFKSLEIHLDEKLYKGSEDLRNYIVQIYKKFKNSTGLEHFKIYENSSSIKGKVAQDYRKIITLRVILKKSKTEKLEFDIEEPHPETYQDLIDKIQSYFKNRLPNYWSLKNTKSQSIKSQEDYKNLLSERALTNEPVEIKIHVESFLLENPGEGYFIVQIHPEAKKKLEDITCLAIVLSSNDDKSKLRIIFDLESVKCFYNNEKIFEVVIIDRRLTKDEFVPKKGFWILIKNHKLTVGLIESGNFSEINEVRLPKSILQDRTALKYLRIFGGQDPTRDITQDIFIHSDNLAGTFITPQYFGLINYPLLSDMPEKLHNQYKLFSDISIDKDLLKAIAKSANDSNSIFRYILQRKVRKSRFSFPTLAIQLRIAIESLPERCFVLHLWPPQCINILVESVKKSKETSLYDYEPSSIIRILYGELEFSKQDKGNFQKNPYFGLRTLEARKDDPYYELKAQDGPFYELKTLEARKDDPYYELKTLKARKDDFVELPSNYNAYNMNNRTNDFAISLHAYTEVNYRHIKQDKFEHAHEYGYEFGYETEHKHRHESDSDSDSDSESEFDLDASMEELIEIVKYDKEGTIMPLECELKKLAWGIMTNDVFDFLTKITIKERGVLRFRAKSIAKAFRCGLKKMFCTGLVPVPETAKKFLELISNFFEVKDFVERISPERMKLFIGTLFQAMSVWGDHGLEMSVWDDNRLETLLTPQISDDGDKDSEGVLDQLKGKMLRTVIRGINKIGNPDLIDAIFKNIPYRNCFPYRFLIIIKNFLKNENDQQ